MTCKCGCGQTFNPSDATLWRIKNGGDSGYIYGHHAKKGPNNKHWKGGRFISNGYVYLLRPDRPNALKKGCVGYIAEHRLTMSDHIGRPLETSELVHHINGNKSDNRLENLVIITRADHAAHHHTGESNVNWSGGRKPIGCQTCHKEFFPKDRRNDYGAKFCSQVCYRRRNKH